MKIASVARIIIVVFFDEFEFKFRNVFFSPFYNLNFLVNPPTMPMWRTIKGKAETDRRRKTGESPSKKTNMRSVRELMGLEPEPSGSTK